MALEYGHVQIAELLISRGANIDSTDEVSMYIHEYVRNMFMYHTYICNKTG